MRLSIVIKNANTLINIPKHPKNGEEWKKFKVIKAYHNVNNINIGTNKIFFLKFDKCDNNGYTETTTGKIIRYDYSFFMHPVNSFDEVRLYSNPHYIYFNDERTDKININVVNIDGDEPTAADLDSAKYMILEIELE